MTEEALDLLPYEFARVNRVLLRTAESDLLLAPSAPDWAVSEVVRMSNGALTVQAVADQEFDAQLSLLYSGRQNSSESVMADMKDFVDMESAAAELEDAGDLLDAENDAPIVRLLNAVIAESLKENASDIHIEPYEKEALVRFRLDGVLRTVLSPSIQIAPLLISRIKVMSKLDIAERRLPQDGRMSVRLGGRSIDLRVSTMPSSHGERVVMRLLDKDAGKLKTDDLGMPQETKAQLVDLVSRPHGIILVTGPTGSGKTTTLYAALQQMDRQQRNIMTVEDPVEYRVPGITQVEVNDKIDLTFGRALRSILRQDPDVLLVGEIRDDETADICLRSAMTGHLVLSTLHTRDAMSTPFRLLDMASQPFMVATSLQAVIAQRLVRLNCLECAEPHVASLREQAWLDAMLEPDDSLSPQCGRGCLSCNGSGYAGRKGVYEMLEMDAALIQGATDSDPVAFMETARERMKGQTMAHHALELVRQGRTSLAEALRIGVGAGHES